MNTVDLLRTLRWSTFGAAVLGAVGLAPAAMVASDNAANTAYAADRITSSGQPTDGNGNEMSFTGLNGGTGFGPWTVVGQQNNNVAGAFIGTESSNGNAYCFDLYTADGGTATPEAITARTQKNAA